MPPSKRHKDCSERMGVVSLNGGSSGPSEPYTSSVRHVQKREMLSFAPRNALQYAPNLFQ